MERYITKTKNLRVPYYTRIPISTYLVSILMFFFLLHASDPYLPFFNLVIFVGTYLNKQGIFFGIKITNEDLINTKKTSRLSVIFINI